MNYLRQRNIMNMIMACFRQFQPWHYFLLMVVYSWISPTHSVAQVEKVDAGPNLQLVNDETYNGIVQFYEYDRNIPLDARIVGKQELPEGNREKVIFTGINHSQVPAYLVIPKSSSDKYPVVLLVDGIYGSKERWFEDESWPRGGLITKGLLKVGFAVMVLDAVYHGERSAENKYLPPPWPWTYPYSARHMIIQTAMEYRRAIDYLATRPEIDSNQIGILGLSMGGLITFELAAVESRIKSAVAGVTPAFREPEFQSMSPITFAGHIRSNSFLMLMGNQDRYYSMEEARQLYALISIAQKELVEYDGGHRPPIEYIAKVTEWFVKNLR